MAVRELGSAPSRWPMYARAGVALIPGSSRLPVIGGQRAREVPEVTLALDEAQIEPERLAGYAEVCSFATQDPLPPTYPHLLAFPLQLSLMTDPQFPFPAIGLVHIVNRITQHRPIGASERLSLRVWAGGIEPHPRGRQFALYSQVRVGEELVWEEVSINLRRGRGEDAARDPAGVPSSEGLERAATWELSGDLGRRYGWVSGDLNPIHIHSLSARLFGFPSAIAHGMWTKARCLAELGTRLPEAFTVEVAFRRPIPLPGSVAFVEGTDGSGAIRFGVRSHDGDTGHLDGRVRSL